ncbi:dihydrofolate reductase [Paenibacillus cremeus]|uniref:Dihydrofolate reductase n=1 Tax=Paenibacillus cremeus TaxID=2163881 RepID=A0A559K3Z6_9BACL|nr:dihydrofolate reductase [Paenibacillus cremeus]TVY06863.1 dihydrofolate reductase [Paenibacillus cremeus]
MISFVFAMDEARGIGMENRLPWYLPNDFAFFRRLTTGHTVLMGRKTLDSIGKPLPKRHNVVLTRDRSVEIPGCEVIHSVDEVVERYGRGGVKEGEELFVIGGVETFLLFLPYADRMYITEIMHRFPADTFFPEVDAHDWVEVTRERGLKDEKNPYDYDFVVYDRVRG